MPHINTSQSIYNKLIDLTANKESARIEKLEKKERILALKIIQAADHNPVLSAKEQRTLDSIGFKLDTFKRLGCMEKLKAIWNNIFHYSTSSKKIIRLVETACKFKHPSPEANQLLGRMDQGDDIQKKKAPLYLQAKNLFEHHRCPQNLRVTSMDESTKADFNPKNPSWLKERYNSKNTLKITNNPEFYDYETTGNKTPVWVDFANSAFGGGAGVHGFVQEEIMLLECFDLFELLAKTEDPARPFWSRLDIRSGDKDKRNRVGKGHPNPLFIRNAHRVQNVEGVYGRNNKIKDGKIVRHGIEDISPQEFKQKVKPLNKSQEINILAMAAPKLHSKEPREQYHYETLKDLFNQLYAGLTFALHEEPDLILHSGKLGCGAFNNSEKAVWLLHCLAAQQLGIPTELHDYEDKEKNQYMQVWQELSEAFKGQDLERCLRCLSHYLITH